MALASYALDTLGVEFDLPVVSVLATPFVLAGNRRSVRAFWKEIGKLPRPMLPRTYNDKMFWRRVFDHNPRFADFCDKQTSKDFFHSLKHPVQCPKTLWIGSDPTEYPDELMSDDVVAKQTVAWNQNWFFSERGRDRKEFEQTFKKWMAQPFGQSHREWAYSAAQRKIMAEEIIPCAYGKMQEIKVQVIGGDVYYAMIYVGEKTPNAQSAIFSETGHRLAVTNSITPKRPSHALPASYVVPDCFARAMQAAREIGKDVDYVRVDFMVAEGKLYGGEITPYPSAGLMTNSDPAVLQDMADCWPLEKSWFYQTPQKGWRELYRQELRRFVSRTN